MTEKDTVYVWIIVILSNLADVCNEQILLHQQRRFICEKCNLQHADQ
jgi:hypothetical protein